MQAYTELIPPSAVTHALALPFLGPREENLIVVKTSLLQVFRIRHCTTHEESSGTGRSNERIWLVGEYPLAGTVTGVSAVKAVDSKSGGQTLLVALKDAKLSLVEWDPENHRIRTISIHYYEGENVVHEPFSPGLADCENILTVDPGSRCAALKFGRRQLAILPFRQTGDDMIIDDVDDDVPLLNRMPSDLKTTDAAKVDEQNPTPYSSSFVLPLTALDTTLKHPIDLAFLHEYREPTFGILSAPIAPSMSLAAARKDILTYSAYSLDLEQRASTNLVSVTNLPSDLWKVVPLALPVGGALLLGTNEVVHVDQSGKTLAVAVNEFATTASDMSMVDHSTLDLKLEGCQILPLDLASGDMLLILRDGGMAVLRFRLQGRNVGGITIEGVAPKEGGMVLEVAPSSSALLSSQVAFIGSEDGDSSLVTWSKSSEFDTLSRKRSHAQMLDYPAVAEEEDFDEDIDDDDLYASASTSTAAKRKIISDAANDASTYSFQLIDRLRSLGPINSVSFGRAPAPPTKAKGEFKLQLLAGVGRGNGSRLALMSKEIVSKVKRSDNETFAGASAAWSLRASTSEDEGDETASHYSNMIFSYDGQRTRVHDINLDEDDGSLRYDERIGTEFEHDGETLLVDSIAHGNRIIQCRRTEIRSYDATDLALSQIIPMLDDDTDAELSIVHVSIADPWIAVLRDDGSVLVLQADSGGDVEPMDLSEELSAKTRRWKAGCAYTGILCPGHADAVLGLLDEACELHIFALPSLDRVYHAPMLPFLPAVLSASEQERRRGGLRESVVEILIADLGETGLSSPFLIARCGDEGRDIVVYEPFVGRTLGDTTSGSADVSKMLRFRKICSETEHGSFNDTEVVELPSVDVMRPITAGKYAAVRLARTGAVSLLLKERTALPKALRIRSDGMDVSAIVPLHWKGYERGFALLRSTSTLSGSKPLTNGDSNSDGEIDEETVTVFDQCYLPEDADLSSGWFVRRMKLQHTPTQSDDHGGDAAEIRHIAYHEHGGRGYWVVATCRHVDFLIPGKEDDEVISLRPQVPQYSLHLISAATFRQVHTRTLPYLEIVTDLKTMTLEISEHSHDLGARIVVSAGLQRGEDATARGVLYVFETLDVVPDPALPESGVYLSMFSREETKGVISAIEAFPGGLVGTAQGQKIVVRGLKEDGSCLPVAFLDAQAYTVSLRALASTGLWLAADAAKGLWFGGFTQEPYRLSVLGKSPSRMEVLAAELLPFDGGLYLCVIDGKSDLQVLQYDPENPKSLSGTRLLHKSTFHLGQMVNGLHALPSTLKPDEARAEMNGHTNGQDVETTATVELFQVLTTSLTGAMGLITPLGESTYRRLASLQTHLTNVLEHATGLNPRAYRFAGDETSGGRGIADGSMVKRIWELGSARRGEVLARAGADAWMLQGDVEAIGGGGLAYL